MDKDSGENRWAFDINQNNDIYIYIEKNKNYTSKEIIKSVTIDNIKVEKEKELGSEIPGNASYTEVIVAKNRSGQTGTARLFFYKDYVRFDAPTPEWEAAMNAIAEE